jgi:hypothetical protein
LYNPLTFDYFRQAERTGKAEINLDEAFYNAYNDIYKKENNTNNNTNYSNINLNNNVNSSSNSKETFSIKKNKYISYKEHPFYSKLIQFFMNPNLNMEENASCDEVFSFYIYKVYSLCNSNYFIRVLKYVTLFREFVNTIYSNNNGSEFTQINNAEDVPDVSNEFILDFLKVDSFELGFSRTEAVEITQNFCQWMYDNNFTSSKLCLLSR